jgi:hypothetical protein
MSRAKKNKSQEIKRTDGRKNNKRLEPKPISTIKKLVPARQNKAKRDRISSYATNAMKEVFGSEKEAFKHLAELGKKNFTHMKLLMEYAYGKPSDSINDNNNSKKVQVPVINFFNNKESQIQDDVIDVTPEDEQ